MMMTGVRAIFVDTNILLYAANSLSPLHTVATNLLQDSRASGIELFVSSQILREYIAVAIKPAPRGIGLSIPEALADYRLFRTQFNLIYDNGTVLDTLASLLEAYSANSRQIYDVNIVATMQNYGLTHLLTHNVSDFTRFAGMITIIPLLP